MSLDEYINKLNYNAYNFFNKIINLVIRMILKILILSYTVSISNILNVRIEYRIKLKILIMWNRMVQTFTI